MQRKIDQLINIGGEKRVEKKHLVQQQVKFKKLLVMLAPKL